MTAAETLAQVLPNLTHPLTAAELADKTGIKQATVERTLRKMWTDGQAAKVGSADKGGTTWGPVRDGDLGRVEADYRGDPVPVVTDGVTDGQPFADGRLPEDEIAAANQPADDPRPVSPAAAEITDVLKNLDPDGRVQSPDFGPTGQSTTTASGRRRKGYLKRLILDYLAAHPDDQLTPYQLGVALDMKGNGGVNYSTQVMAAAGEIAQVSDKPVKYQDAKTHAGDGATE